MSALDRRDFLKASAVVAGLATATRANASPAIRRLGRPIVISDLSGFQYRNGGAENAVERAFRGMTSDEDPLDALVAGVNIPELDPEESGIGYGGLPNADGVVELDASVMHGPRRWAGAVAGITGVRTPSLVAKAVAERTDHHLIAGEGARKFARDLGMTVEEDLNTPHSRELWLEWRRRVDPTHWLDPIERLRGAGRREEMDPDAIRRRPPGELQAAMRARADAFLAAGLSMVDDGLIPSHSFWGTISCNGVSPTGDICGVTTTSGLAWKIPGRIGDSPILGAGLYLDNAVGAAGSTGRGEANLYNLSSYLIVEEMRRGRSPKDAGMEALRRIRSNTVEPRLLNSRGLPNFDVRFFAVNKAGEYAGVAIYGSGGESQFAVCDENGARLETLTGLLEGSPRDP
jgi:N4-(beta-N-acetylglucosaminyl)-L-asparaginase